MGTNVRTVTHELLDALGLRTLFGNPGSTELGFLQELPTDFRYVLGLHEAAAVAMADGYAQARNGAALVNLHSASGLGNAMGSLVNAFHNRAPLVVVVGQQDRRHLASEPYLFARSVELARPYVKWATEPPRASDVPGAILRAHQLALTAPQGPTLVSVPASDWDEPSSSPPPPTPPPARVEPGAAGIDALRDLLAEAAHPAMVVGAGIDVSGAWAEAVAVAEALDCPVWSAPQAPRACFPEDHRLFQGHLAIERAGASEQLAGHDLVWLIGAPAFAFLTYTEAREPLAPLAHLSDDPDELSRSGAVLTVLGDVRAGLQALLSGSPLRASASPVLPRDAEPAPPGSTPLTAARFMAELAVALAPDDILVEEAPSTRGELRLHVRRVRPGTFFASASGGLGFALPAAVGVQLARPSRSVVCLVGDGSALFGLHALWSAVRERAAVCVVVLNNGGYQILRDLAAAGGRRGVPGLDIPGFDFVLAAAAMGCDTARVDGPGGLGEVLGGRPRDRPLLVEVPIEVP